MSDNTSSEKESVKPASDIKNPRSRLTKIVLSVGAFIVAAIAFLANGTTVVQNVSGLFEPQQPNASTPTSASELSRDLQFNYGQSGTPTDTAHSECFIVDKTTRQSADCSIPHNAELISNQKTCSEDALFEFLGAKIGTDTLRHDLQVAEIPNAGCLLTLPSGIQVTGSLKMSLPLAKGAFLRQCYDAIRDRDVGCDEIHTAEVVRTFKQGDTSIPRCIAAAEEYLGVQRKRFDDQLSVELEASATTSRCIAKVRGENILTTTLRNISQSALPLSADDGSRS